MKYMKHVIIYISNHLNFAFIKKMARSVYVLSNYCIRTYSNINHPNCGTISVATTVLVKWLHSQLWSFHLKQLSKLLTQQWLDSWNLLAELLGKYDIHSTHIYAFIFKQLIIWDHKSANRPFKHQTIPHPPFPCRYKHNGLTTFNVKGIRIFTLSFQ